MLEKRWDHIRNVKSDRNRSNKNTYLVTKNGFRHEFQSLWQSNGITVILIRFCVNGCLRHAREMVRSKTKCKMWRRQNKNKHLPSSQKNGLRLEFLTLRQSDSITIFLIKFCVDWCLSHAWETVRSDTNCKIATATEIDESLTIVTKKPIATRVANSALIQ